MDETQTPVAGLLDLIDEIAAWGPHSGSTQDPCSCPACRWIKQEGGNLGNIARLKPGPETVWQ